MLKAIILGAIGFALLPWILVPLLYATPIIAVYLALKGKGYA